MKETEKGILSNIYTKYNKFKDFEDAVNGNSGIIELKGLYGSALSVYHSAYISRNDKCNLVILPDKETAAYYYNDLEDLIGEADVDVEKRQILFFPNTYKSINNLSEADRINIQARIEVIKRISKYTKKTTIVSYAEAVAEQSITPKEFQKSSFVVSVKMQITVDALYDYLVNNGYDRVDFVIEPGQFSIRGSIFDVYSYSNEYPFRLEFSGDEIASLRSFNPVSQLSIKGYKSLNILPVFDKESGCSKQSLIDSLPKDSFVIVEDIDNIVSKIESLADKTGEQSMITKEMFLKSLINNKLLLTGSNTSFKKVDTFTFNTHSQLDINKHFDILIEHLIDSAKDGYTIYICSETATQITRIKHVIDELLSNLGAQPEDVDCKYIELSLHKGFVDEDNLIEVLTDHQIFNRYHKFDIKDRFERRKIDTVQKLTELKPGDYITHIDYGIGRFAGLEKIVNNGVEQEAIRLVYANDDLLYINIHSLYKISKYSGSEGREPKLNKLGSSTWATLKSGTKKKVKDIAKGLIKLYAERRNSQGFAFSADTYMQHELEASFMYEDTPDQVNATIDVKNDMEKSYPMERLICGDVGFGKTEVAVRAAFKAVADSKQVIVLVPTTILALQHYQTFSSRLHDFPVTVDYINRFRTSAQQKQIVEDVAKGKIDILIGTHIVLNSKFKFKDLGLLIIDEEQKFGVAAKEKLKQLKVNIDTLTMTATPIPRTLQFSLMGARDLSILRTPPPNRQPVHTELCTFDDKLIRDAIDYEISRGGQVFFVHNRVQNLPEVAAMLRKILPGISIAIAHGQMNGTELENVMIDFIDGRYDVLLCTKIIESGLDIPNVNTIIINEANYYGLSELHQLRGRVGRSDKKAFCYLIAPPMSTLTDDAQKRLKAIEEFADLGSGFNLAMRDLDIRGAGNILGAEQSGFISDIGFEIYQKILNEAISELKSENIITDNSSEDFFGSHDYTSSCQIDIDQEAFTPDNYISNLSERMKIYREINEFKAEDDFADYQLKLIDRFGTVPPQLSTLFEVLKIKIDACKLGIEKVIFKKGVFKCYFLSSENHAYYESPTFERILEYIKTHVNSCRVGDKSGKMTIEFIRSKYEPAFIFTDVRKTFKELNGENNVER